MNVVLYNVGFTAAVVCLVIITILFYLEWRRNR